jgi:hypothetical protein
VAVAHGDNGLAGLALRLRQRVRLPVQLGDAVQVGIDGRGTVPRLRHAGHVARAQKRYGQHPCLHRAVVAVQRHQQPVQVDFAVILARNIADNDSAVRFQQRAWRFQPAG